MQAKITYLLTEAAQRAQMAAVGGPVARKQVVTCEVTAEDLPLLQADDDGNLYLNLCPGGSKAAPPLLTGEDRTVPHRDALYAAGCPAGEQSYMQTPSHGPYTLPIPLIPDANANILDLVRAGQAVLAAKEAAAEADREKSREQGIAHLFANPEEVWSFSSRELSNPYGYDVPADHPRFDEILAEIKRRKTVLDAKKAAELEAKRAAGQTMIDRFLADPTARATAIDSGWYHWIELPFPGPRLHKDDMGQEAITKVVAEAARRNDADKAAKEKAKAAKEAAKMEFLHAWIAEHGDESQRARDAEGLLPRDEAVKALADATFAVLGEGFPLHEQPRQRCTDERCLGGYGEGCEESRHVVETVDGLDAPEYTQYRRIHAAAPGAQFVLRKHSVQHDCEHNGDGCEVRHNCGVMVKIVVGPFTLQREYAL
jgi:hypothetical protein